MDLTSVPVPVVFAIAGVVFLFLGVLGGGIEVNKIKIPPVPPIVRIMVGTVGVVLIGVSIWLFLFTPDNGQKPTAAIPSTGLEAELSKANIILTEVDSK